MACGYEEKHHPDQICNMHRQEGLTLDKVRQRWQNAQAQNRGGGFMGDYLNMPLVSEGQGEFYLLDGYQERVSGMVR